MIHIFLFKSASNSSMNWGNIWEDNDSSDQYLEGADDVMSAIFQEQVRDRWNLEYLEAVSAEYFRLGLVR